MRKKFDAAMAEHAPEIPPERRALKAKRAVVGLGWGIAGFAVLVVGLVTVLKASVIVGLLLVLLGFFAGIYGSNIVSGDVARSAGKNAGSTISSLVSSLGGILNRK